MNLFFLISFLLSSGALAAVVLMMVIWKELSLHLRTVQRSLVRKVKPLADAARLDRAARRLNHATLRFDAADWAMTGRI